MQQVNATNMPPPSSPCPEVPSGPQGWGEKQDATMDVGNEPAKGSLMSRRDRARTLEADVPELGPNPTPPQVWFNL